MIIHYNDGVQHMECVGTDSASDRINIAKPVHKRSFKLLPMNSIIHIGQYGNMLQVNPYPCPPLNCQDTNATATDCTMLPFY